MQNQHATDALLQAAKAADWVRFDELIAKGYPINGVHPKSGASIVHMLAQEEDCEQAVFDLIKRGASKNKAVAGAAVGNRVSLVRVLLKKGADPNFAVYGAAQGNHKALVQECLQKGGGQSWAARGATRGGHSELASKALETHLNKPENANAIIGEMFSGFQSGNLFQGLTTMITKGAGAAVKEMNIRDAAMGNNDTAVEGMLFMGGDVNEAITGAAMYDNIRLVDKLLTQQGAKPTCAIWGAAYRDNQERVRQLLQRYASQTNKMRKAALKGAAAGGQLDFVQTLIREGGDINLAVVVALDYQHDGFVQRLIRDGADPNLAMKHAVTKKHLQMTKALLAQGGDIHFAMQVAIDAKYSGFVKFLVENGADKKLAIEYAAKKENLKMVQLLITLGADKEDAILEAVLNDADDFVAKLK